MQNANTDLHRQGEAVSSVAKEFRCRLKSMLRFALHCICVTIM
jgi:hypothetical protein